MIWASDPCNLKLHNPGQGVNFMIALNRDAGMIASWRLVRIESSLGGARKHRDHPYCLFDSYCSHESCLVFSRSRRFNANNTLSPAHASTVWLFLDNLFRTEGCFIQNCKQPSYDCTGGQFENYLAMTPGTVTVPDPGILRG